jgi:protein-L-isoaspartate(D-aspartate) O-methyltransferase
LWWICGGRIHGQGGNRWTKPPGHGLGGSDETPGHGVTTSLEIWDDLADAARRNLKAHDIENVEVVVGDGSLGIPSRAPFDAVLVSAAFTRVPQPLIDQLVDGGRLVQPIGRGGDGMVTLFLKSDERLVRVREVIPARFVRLFGEEGFPGGPDIRR